MFYDKQELEGERLIKLIGEKMNRSNRIGSQNNHHRTETTDRDTNNQLSTPSNLLVKKSHITSPKTMRPTRRSMRRPIPSKQLSERSASSSNNTQHNQQKDIQSTKTHSNNEEKQITTDEKQWYNNNSIVTLFNKNGTPYSFLLTRLNDAKDNAQQSTNDQTNLLIDQSNNEETQSEESQVQTNENSVIEQMATSTTITHCENNAEAEDHTQLEPNQPSQHETETNTDNDEQAIRTTADQQPNQLRRITRGIISTARQHPIAVVTGICALTVGICAGAFGIEPAVAFASNQLQRILSLFPA